MHGCDKATKHDSVEDPLWVIQSYHYAIAYQEPHDSGAFVAG